MNFLASHVTDYMSKTGVTCWSCNDEAVESVHALLERRSLRHGLKNSKSLVGEFKLQEAKALLDLFNAKLEAKIRYLHMNLFNEMFKIEIVL